MGRCLRKYRTPPSISKSDRTAGGWDVGGHSPSIQLMSFCRQGPSSVLAAFAWSPSLLSKDLALHFGHLWVGARQGVVKGRQVVTVLPWELLQLPVLRQVVGYLAAKQQT